MPKTLSVLLGLLGAVFGISGAISSARQLRAYYFWPRVTAVVGNITVHPVGANPYGGVNVELRYSSRSAQNSVWAYKSFLPGRGDKFVNSYAVGTTHLIWIDPAKPEEAELGLGLNVETLLVPLILWAVAACLLFAARYFWRMRREVSAA